MSYEITFLKKAKKDIVEFERSGKGFLVRKIYSLIQELKIHPYIGTGQPEMLKHDLAGYWSRRIDHEHRLVYAVDENLAAITIVSVKGHYTL
jgi:toxin YoeB